MRTHFIEKDGTSGKMDIARFMHIPGTTPDIHG